MDDKTQKERLEQELRFLKESFDAEVISKEEFEKGKDRIEKKLKEIQNQAKEQISEEPQPETAAERQEKAEEAGAKEPKKESTTKEAEKPQAGDEEYFEPAEIKEEKEHFEKPKEAAEEEKRENKFFKYAVLFVVLVLAAFFLYSSLKGNIQKPEEKLTTLKEAEKTNVIILNDRKSCFNCDTERILSILEGWFGALNAEEIDYSTDEGRNLAERFDAKTLPVYILDENITKKPEFGQFRQIFIKKDDKYILSDDAAASTFYFKRENVPSKLDLFVVAGDRSSIKAEKNLEEFLKAFKEVKFERHSPTDKLSQELEIKIFPTFLVNNRVKFSGIHSADTIKNNFCRLNKLPECERSLSKSLI